MLSNTNWTQLIKEASRQERMAAFPSTTVTGKVISSPPLKIEINQQFVLSEEFLLVPHFFSDFEVELDVEVDVETKVVVEVEVETDKGPATGEGTGTGEGIGVGKAKGTFKNALETGDKVILIRADGGQTYTIIGRLGK